VSHTVRRYLRRKAKEIVPRCERFSEGTIGGCHNEPRYIGKDSSIQIRRNACLSSVQLGSEFRRRDYWRSSYCSCLYLLSCGRGVRDQHATADRLANSILSGRRPPPGSIAPHSANQLLAESIRHSRPPFYRISRIHPQRGSRPIPIQENKAAQRTRRPPPKGRTSLQLSAPPGGHHVGWPGRIGTTMRTFPSG
jgi:hypothetical protein